MYQCWFVFNSAGDFEDFVFFWSKMVYKKLHELTANELRIELKRVGIRGKYIKAEAIMRLTTHLIDVSEDPITFEFDPDNPIEDDATDNDEYGVETDVVDMVTVTSTTEGGAASVSSLVNTISGGASTTTTSVTTATTTTPFVALASSGSLTAPTVSTTSSTMSFPYSQMEDLGIRAPPGPQIQMQSPYNPILYPGMPGGDFYARYQGIPPTPAYQGIPPTPAYPGLPPSGPTPPWSGMWTPWGGWTPLVHPASTPAAPPAAASSGMSPNTVLNPAMAEFTGACPPPARSSETKSTKITSGQYDSGRREVKERQNWPQVMIDHILNPEPMDYDEMDWAILTAGMTGKILAEMDPTSMDVATVNKLKHLNRRCSSSNLVFQKWSFS